MAETPEFSRPVRLDTLGAGAREEVVEADAAERAALAVRFGLLGLDRLHATAMLTRDGDRIRCEGRLQAMATQACVASGDPVPAAIDEPFALRFVPAADVAQEEELELDAADLDVIGYTGNAVDVGEAVAQTLALALDPFPRAANAETALRDAGVVGEEDVGPFAALKALKGRL